LPDPGELNVACIQATPVGTMPYTFPLESFAIGLLLVESYHSATVPAAGVAGAVRVGPDMMVGVSVVAQPTAFALLPSQTVVTVVTVEAVVLIAQAFSTFDGHAKVLTVLSCVIANTMSCPAVAFVVASVELVTFPVSVIVNVWMDDVETVNVGVALYVTTVFTAFDPPPPATQCGSPVARYPSATCPPVQ
jgi:hypothetical protein